LFFHEIVSISNLFSAWDEFKRGKTKKQDVAAFAENLEEHVFGLARELSKGVYRHSPYSSFFIADPKRRNIHKAIVKDRLVHHAIFRVLEPMFDKTFIYDSYSSRRKKGIHKAHERFRSFAWKLSRNNTRTVWILKCDIRRFFDSVDHAILGRMLEKHVDEQTFGLLKGIIRSFEKTPGKGIPIGNLTSQLFSNLYLNLLDQYMKRRLSIKHYIRYADDFVVISRSKEELFALVPVIRDFLQTELLLELHPDKVLIRKWHQGVDFLGYVMFPHHILLRTRTKRRAMWKLTSKQRLFEEEKITEESLRQSAASYFGMLSHARGRTIRKQLLRIVKREE
jgi:RNA-directed DNA polymerase